MAKDKKIGDAIVRAAFDSSTYNEQEHSIEMVFATEEKVFIRHWEGDHYQVLVCNKDNIRAERLDNGAVHMLDTHNDSSVKHVYGRVISWRIENSKCIARIALSNDPDKAGIVTDIKTGIIRTCSIKARPWAATADPQTVNDKFPTYRITDWEPMEISLAAVPADAQSIVRSDNNNNHSINILLTNTSEMEQKDILEIITRCADKGLDLAFAKGLIEKQPKLEDVDGLISTEVERRAKTTETPAATPPVTEPAKAPVTGADSIELQIISRCEAAGLDLVFAKDLITRKLDVNAANAAIVDEIARKNPNNILNNHAAPKVTGPDEKDIIRTAVQDGLIHRAGDTTIQLNEKSREYRNMSMVDIARNCIIQDEMARGGGFEKAYRMANSLSKQDVIKRALATTDYPDLLTSTVNRQLRRYYTPQNSNWQQLSQRTTVNDFREKTGLEFDGNATFQKIAEGGEYKAKSELKTGKATIKVDTYGHLIVITRKAMINDDLDVLSRIPKEVAQGALDLQADMVFGLLNAGHTTTKTPDNVALFHAASHSNYVSTGTAMSETTINDGIVAMAKQKSPAGKLLNIQPKYLVVPLEKVMLAKKLMAGITAGTTNDVNTLQGALEIITDARLSAVSAISWYLFAGNQVEGLMHAYLEGEEGLYTDSRTDFMTDNIETKARLEFGVAAWNHRAWFKNTGA